VSAGTPRCASRPHRSLPLLHSTPPGTGYTPVAGAAPRGTPKDENKAPVPSSCGLAPAPMTGDAGATKEGGPVTPVLTGFARRMSRGRGRGCGPAPVTVAATAVTVAALSGGGRPLEAPCCRRWGRARLQVLSYCWAEVHLLCWGR